VEKSCIASLEPIPRVKGELVHFFWIFGFWGSGLLYEIGLAGFGNRSNRFWWNRSDRFWEPAWPVCAQSWHLFRGSVHMCRGSSCLLWWFVLFGWAWFVSDVSSRCPCLKGSRLVFFKWSCSFPFSAFDRLLESLFLFVSFFLFSLITKCVCCQCTHQGGDWGPCVVRGPVDGRFLMWWAIDNVVWIDSWPSNAGAGCGLTGVGAGEEQARKVVAGEASRCGEAK
jgi:hypothetical protein